jgi:hypothetical protein
MRGEISGSSSPAGAWGWGFLSLAGIYAQRGLCDRSLGRACLICSGGWGGLFVVFKKEKSVHLTCLVHLHDLRYNLEVDRHVLSLHHNLTSFRIN